MAQEVPEIKIVNRDVDSLIDAEYNPRQITEKQFKELCDSIKIFGFLEPVIVNMNPDRKNVLIAGHQRKRACVQMGITTIPTVEVNLSLEREKELNVRHNKSGGTFDMDALANWFTPEELEDWGFEKWELDIEPFEFGGGDDDDDEKDENYTRKIESPTYEPKGEKPSILDCINLDKFHELMKDIESRKDLTDEERTLLQLSAHRHIVFNYEKIADFYAHSEKNVQELMEDSALVIIDFEKAIEKGFVKLSEDISKVYTKDKKDEG